ncbi:MAG: HlyC/CorC family transporter [Alphaproteobacteria bacterium]|nr:MAG: HlyC/CorC family transporter [Alphaproteobacteria bacterium]
MIDSTPSQSLVSLFKNWLLRKIGRSKAEQDLRETIEEIIEDRVEEQSPIAGDEKKLLANILRLSGVTVNDVMVPRSDIIAVEASLPFNDIVKAVIESGHSRLPVYRETLDDVIGIVHIKDVFSCYAQEKSADLHRLFLPPLFISPSMRALDLLLKMRVTHKHLALVVDEYGGTNGLVTIEDLIEEIVGEIEDEHDVAEAPKLMPRPDGTVFADARATIEEFEDWAGPILDDEEREEIDTVGGLVFALIGRVPGRGEIVTHPSGLEFEIIDADPRRIKRVRVKKTPLATPELKKTADA